MGEGGGEEKEKEEESASWVLTYAKAIGEGEGDEKSRRFVMKLEGGGFKSPCTIVVVRVTYDNVRPPVVPVEGVDGQHLHRGEVRRLQLSRARGQ